MNTINLTHGIQTENVIQYLLSIILHLLRLHAFHICEIEKSVSFIWFALFKPKILVDGSPSPCLCGETRGGSHIWQVEPTEDTTATMEPELLKHQWGAEGRWVMAQLFADFTQQLEGRDRVKEGTG